MLVLVEEDIMVKHALWLMGLVRRVLEVLHWRVIKIRVRLELILIVMIVNL